MCNVDVFDQLNVKLDGTVNIIVLCNILTYSNSNIINTKKSNELGVVHFHTRSLSNQENKSKIESFLRQLPQIPEITFFF